MLEGESFTAENGVWTWKFLRADGPRTRSINITAYSTGGSASASATATVLNVAPYVYDLRVEPAAIDEGASATLRGQIKDPGADTFTLYLDWDGNGSWDEILPRGSAREFSLVHAYPDDDPTDTPSDVKTIRVAVRDDDQSGDPPPSSSESTGPSAAVTVNNVIPVVTAAAPTTPIIEVGDRAIVEAGPAGVGTPFKAAGTFDDDGQDDTFDDSVIDYDDGPDPVDLPLAGNAFTVPDHYYLEAGDYLADVRIVDDDTGTSESTTISQLPVTAVRLGDLTVTDAVHAGNLVRSAGLLPPHLFVGQQANGTAAVLLDLAVQPAGSGSEITRHLLWRVTGDDVIGAASGNFALPPTVTLAPDSDAHRTFTAEAGFDDDGDTQLDGGEVSRRAEVHVILADLDADSDNNNGTGMPARDGNEDGMEAVPPGKYVLLNDDDDNNNDVPDLTPTDAPVDARENDLVPLVIGFEHLGNYRTGLQYELSVGGTGLERVRVWDDAAKMALARLGTRLPVPQSAYEMVWVEGRALSQVEGDVQLDMKVFAQRYLPGYGPQSDVNTAMVPKVSTGSFREPDYTGQAMKLLLEGLGEGMGIDEVTFKITDVSTYPGFAGNGMDPKVEGDAKDDDYSFKELADDKDESGTMEANITYAPFWAKDYGGQGTVQVRGRIGADVFKFSPSLSRSTLARRRPHAAQSESKGTAG